MKRRIPSNRRKHPRLKVEKSARIQVHLFPVLPFLGISVDATLFNLSAGGMALRLNRLDLPKEIRKNGTLKIHFRLPGSILTECRAVITHRYHLDETNDYLGLKFTNKPLVLSRAIHQMAFDNEICDRRIQEMTRPWCDPSCAFLGLCRKPLREKQGAPRLSTVPLEIALQSSI